MSCKNANNQRDISRRRRRIISFYDYIAVSGGCEYCSNQFEARQSIKDEPLTKCPLCEAPVHRLISCPAGCVFRGRQMNQMNDVKYAKYWRDNNGIRHKVTAADGSLNSPTVSSKITASPELAEARKKRDMAKTRKKLDKIRHGFIKKD